MKFENIYVIFLVLDFTFEILFYFWFSFIIYLQHLILKYVTFLKYVILKYVPVNIDDSQNGNVTIGYVRYQLKT